MIVIDTNIIAYLFIQGDRTDSAQQLLMLEPQVIVPVLWRHEFLNVVTTYIRHGGVTLTTGNKIINRALKFLATSESDVDFSLALKLATEHHCSAYGAQFAACAMQHSIKLVTEDAKLIRAFPACASNMTDYIAQHT